MPRLPRRSPALVRLVPPVVVGLAVLLAGCSSGGASGATGSLPAPGAGDRTAVCRQPGATAHVPASPVPGSTSDWNITSFDGTRLRVHWFPDPDAHGHPVPTVLMGPGWSLPGDTDTAGTDLLGDIAIRDLWTAGYNVLTWDPRGFGQSGGQAEVDSPDYEARDVSTLITWVATRPGVELDAPGDPRLGMVGGSYGGGIQLVAAARDCRIDAIVPTIAWHSLVTSLDKTGIVKAGWAGILSDLSSSDHVAPEVTASDRAGWATGTITAAERRWFAARGPGAGVGSIRVPTLFVQGTVDTLFTLQEAVTNYEILRRHGVTTSMLWYCGGHGVCLTASGDQELPVSRAIEWLDRYVKDDRSVATGPTFEFVDQRGDEYSAPSYPLPLGAPVTGQGSGTLDLVATGGSGPADTAGSTQELAGLVAGITPARATNAVDVDVAFGRRSGVVVGAPVLRLRYRGTVAAGTRPERVFAQLVDPSTGLVVGNQVTPVAVTLDGRTHTATVPLEMVAFTGTAGSHLELQLVATTVAYAQPRLGGSVDFSHLQITLPVAARLRPR